jgi:hypothetical protein
MADWSYGKMGTAYPVARGQIWRVGNHLFVCSDLMESSLFEQQLVDVKVGILYCDPPWGAALLNGFRTKAGLDKATHTWQELYRKIADFGHSRNAPVFLEGSVNTNRDGVKIPETMRITPGFEHYWEIKYYKKHPSGLFYSGGQPVIPSLVGPNNPLEHVDDDEVPSIIMDHYQRTYPLISKVVIDPTTGMGATPLEAQRVGWSSINNELNPNRISVSLSRLVKMTGLPAERVR